MAKKFIFLISCIEEKKSKTLKKPWNCILLLFKEYYLLLVSVLLVPLSIYTHVYRLYFILNYNNFIRYISCISISIYFCIHILLSLSIYNFAKNYQYYWCRYYTCKLQINILPVHYTANQSTIIIFFPILIVIADNT